MARAAPVSRRDTAIAVGVAILGLGALAWLGLDLSSWPDWSVEAAPSVGALLHGHLGAFLREAPPYGGSLLLRAPFMAVVALWHGGGKAVYRAGALPCMAALAGLGVWLARGLARRGCGPAAQGLAVLLCVANPLAVPALQLGHPEELLGAALSVLAVLCAQRDRPLPAGVLVAVAIANKPWGVLAAGPVLVALPHGHRARALVAMGVVAVAFTAPFVLAHGTSVAGQAAGAGVITGDIFNPWQLWWFLGTHSSAAGGPPRVAPGWLDGLGHTLPIAMMPPLTLLYARRRRGRPVGDPDAMLLLCLLLALRCALDPWDISYYTVPCLVALLTWETSVHRRAPVIALAATFACWFSMVETSALLSGDDNALAFAFTLMAVPGITTLGRALYARPSGDPVTVALPAAV